MEIHTLKAEQRTEIGTKASRIIRERGLLPAIVYGHGEGSKCVSLNRHEMENELHHGAHLVRLDLDGSKQQCLIREVQYDHLGIAPIHVDLTRVSMDEKVTVTVGVETKGTPKGLTAGTILDLQMATIDVECLVHDIPEVLRINVSDLDRGEAKHVRDLDLPENVVPLADPGAVVVMVGTTAAARAAEESTEGEETESTEPEVIGRKKEDEEEGKTGE